MNNLIKRCALLLAALLLTAASTVTVFAAPSGSVSYQITYQGNPVGGGNLCALQFASLNDEETDFVWLEPFEACGLHLFEAAEPQFADDLLRFYVEYNSNSENKDNQIPVLSQTIDAEGRVSFQPLPSGLYLFWQTEPAAGYETLSPFVVSIPMTVDGERIYDIDGSPKPRPLIAETTAAPESTASEGGREVLPQTGLLQWPIPGFFLYGTFFVLLGVIIRME